MQVRAEICAKIKAKEAEEGENKNENEESTLAKFEAKWRPCTARNEKG